MTVRSLTRARRLQLVSIEAFLGIGAVYGGYALIRDAAGFGLDDDWLRGGVFTDYTIPGAILIVVIGGGMLTAAALALRSSRYALEAARVAGALLLGFLVVETALVGYHGRQQVLLLAICAGGSARLVLVDRRQVVGRGTERQVHAVGNGGFGTRRDGTEGGSSSL